MSAGYALPGRCLWRLGIAHACRSGVSAPCAATPGPDTENSRIRFDDPVRVHPTAVRRNEAIHNPSRRPKDGQIRRAVAIDPEIADDNRPGFAAGTHSQRCSGHLGRSPPRTGSRASGALAVGTELGLSAILSHDLIIPDHRPSPVPMGATTAYEADRSVSRLDSLMAVHSEMIISTTAAIREKS